MRVVLVPDHPTQINSPPPDMERVVVETTEAIERDLWDADAYLNRGLAYSEIGELDPHAWSGYRHMGIVLHMTGDGDARYRDYLRARKLQEEA